MDTPSGTNGSSGTGNPVSPIGPNRPRTEVDSVVIRFCGDSGDGMQLTGTEFTKSSALAGNDLATFPDFPAEIRAPAGTLAGVSGFQLNFSSNEVLTPGDQPDVLVAMNPAALQTNIDDLAPGGTLIVNTGAFTAGNLEKAGYKSNPLDDGTCDKYRCFKIDISKLTAGALDGLGMGSKDVARCKNFFALGLMFWMYNRPTDGQIRSIEAKFKKNPQLVDANVRAFKAGHAYGETTEMFPSSYVVAPAKLPPGKYRNITGNQATALGIVAAAKQSGIKVFLGSYPITPASDVLHELSMYRNFDVVTFQAEDEIAAIGTVIGASFGGALAVTTTSGPGLDLKSEALGLALTVELPMVIVDIQRGGPSTGLPTKTEQADLLHALYGRHGESPLPIIAARSPADCFDTAFLAFRIAVKYMTPVILLTDGYIANGAEPWLLPKIGELPPFEVTYRTDPNGYFVYKRNGQTLARDWVIPGTPGLEHRVGGLEKDALTGNVSYDPENHDAMCRTRAAKVAAIVQDIPPTEIEGPQKGKLLLVGWGGTYGAITQAAKVARGRGLQVSNIHLRHMNPLPPDLGEILGRFEQVLVPELNLGQLSKVIRSEYLIPAEGLNKVQGKPFKVSEIVDKIEKMLSGGESRRQRHLHAT